jgi:hypothetical protein
MNEKGAGQPRSISESAITQSANAHEIEVFLCVVFSARSLFREAMRFFCNISLHFLGADDYATRRTQPTR